MQSHCMTCLKHIESEWRSTSTPSNHHFWSNWAASTTSSKWVHMHRKATANAECPFARCRVSTQTLSPKPNDSLILLNYSICVGQFLSLSWSRAKLNTDFRLVRHLDLFGFNHFLGEASPQWVASCHVCLETWMMCHQSSEKSCFTWFENPIIQIWLANSSRIIKTTQVVDISQNWDFGTSIVFVFKHMVDLAEVAAFRFSSGIFGTSCCAWIQSARELSMMSIVAGQCSCSQFTSTYLKHTVMLLIVQTIRYSNQIQEHTITRFIITISVCMM